MLNVAFVHDLRMKCAGPEDAVAASDQKAEPVAETEHVFS